MRPCLRVRKAVMGVLALVTILVAGGSVRAADVTVSADYAQPVVTVAGFGASVTWIAHGINDFSATNQTKILDALYATDKPGAGLSLVRVGTFISNYNPSPGVYNWGHWSISGQMAYIKRVRSTYGVDQVIASTWSPPGYMKDNGSATNGGRLLPAYYPQAAALMVDWLQRARTELGADVTVLSVQNEPNWSASYETCLYSPSEMNAFVVDHLKPAMVAAGVNTTKLMASESAWYNNFDAEWGYPMLNNAGMRAAIDIVGTHAYGPTDDLGVASQACIQYGKPIWQTEDSEGGTFDPSIADGLKWSSDIHRGLTKGRFSALSHWWAWSSYNDNGSLIRTPDSSTVIIPKRVYAIGHYGRFLRPGAVVVSATANNPEVEATVARTPAGKAVVVLANRGSASHTVTVALQNLASLPTSLTPYRTSATEDQVTLAPISVSGGSFTITVPAQSIVTLVDEGTTPPPDITPPAAPTGLVAAGVSSSQISLDWANNSESDLAGYNVYRSTTSGGPYAKLNGSLLTSSALNDTDLSPATTYHYVVTAVDVAGNESPQSAQASASTQAPVATVHVTLVDTLIVGIGKGKKAGQATVTVRDASGNPVANVTVTGTFSGALSETRTGVTNSSGVAVIQTAGTVSNKAGLCFCVTNLTHATLTYDPSANTDRCDFGGSGNGSGCVD